MGNLKRYRFGGISYRVSNTLYLMKLRNSDCVTMLKFSILTKGEIDYEKETCYLG